MKRFKEFYPYYLREHSHPTCRLLHFIGSLCTLIALALVVSFQYWWGLILLPVIGYGFAWVGHFKYEKNRPATFKYPLYSLMGDWKMFWEMLWRKI